MRRGIRMAARIFYCEDGQGLVEYGLLIGLIALVVITALMIFGESLSDYYNGIGTKLSF
jgi:Flp pilus assembly pilin Flp